MERKPTFLCDAMLGKLARWLRICGYDTLYATPQWSDAEVVDHLGDRTLITRDYALVRHGGILLLQDLLDDQLVELGIALDLTFEPVVERCSRCNGVLESSTEGLPPDIEEGWRCLDCSQPFWIGSHWSGITERIAAVNARLNQAPEP